MQAESLPVAQWSDDYRLGYLSGQYRCRFWPHCTRRQRLEAGVERLQAVAAIIDVNCLDFLNGFLAGFDHELQGIAQPLLTYFIGQIKPVQPVVSKQVSSKSNQKAYQA